MPTCDEDFLTCALCMDVYSDPRTLPCLHSFCYGCLCDLLANTCTVRLQSQQNAFKCPLCQEIHAIPQKGASDFRKDFRIASLLDNIKSKSKFTRPKASHEKQAMVDSDNCKSHPDQPLHFYCEEKNVARLFVNYAGQMTMKNIQWSFYTKHLKI